MSSLAERSTCPHIQTPLPGPRARKVIDSEAPCISPSYTRFYPLVVARGEGCRLEDVDGNLFLDFTAGIAVCATGHCHPRVVAAVQQQSEQLLHMCGADFYYESLAQLAIKLAEIAPGRTPKRVFFTNSGAESVEAAIKLARYHTGRQQVIGFYGGFHGRTMGALSITSSKVAQREKFGPLVPGVTHVPFPNPYRTDCQPWTPSSGEECAAFIEQTLFKRTVAAEEVAAILVEPIQGEGGYLVPPDDFHPQLKQLAERHGILYIVDEVQAGFGRTGKMFGIEHFGIEPDIICLAKGIASGMPLGAIVARRNVMDWEPGSHASTYGGNPVACAASLETIALLEEGLVENAARQGNYLLAQLDQLAHSSQLVGDVRGKGLMIGIELVRDRQSKQPTPRERDAVLEICFRHGLVLMGCGESSIRFCPPLVVTREECDVALKIAAAALAEVEQSRRAKAS